MRIARLLNALFLFSFSFLFAAAARAQTAPQPANPLPFTLKPLGHNIYAAIDDAKGDAGANAGFAIGDDGVLIVDSFENPEAAKLLQECWISSSQALTFGVF